MTILYTYTSRVMQKFLGQNVALEREKFKTASYRVAHVFWGACALCLALLEGGGAIRGAA